MNHQKKVKITTILNKYNLYQEVSCFVLNGDELWRFQRHLSCNFNDFIAFQLTLLMCYGLYFLQRINKDLDYCFSYINFIFRTGKLVLISNRLHHAAQL